MAALVRFLREAEVTARRALLVVLVAGAGVAFWRLAEMRREPPEIPFTKVTRERIVATLATNGKVEPIEWGTARAERAAPVAKILVNKGSTVTKNAPLVELDASEARAELSSAESRIAEARAQLEVLARGGRSAEIVDIEGKLAVANLELGAARKERDSLAALVKKNAATRIELESAEERVKRTEAEIQGLQKRRASLVGDADRTIAEARLRDAESAAGLAREKIQKSVIRAPLAGVVYQFDLKPGAFLNPGDIVASIGRLDRVKVLVFVDEPELGRVRQGQAVSITWEAKPGRTWKGSVDRLPTQIVALGTRQVGEVACVIENPDQELLPGTNVNAEILLKTVESTLTIPKEALRRQDAIAGVFMLVSDKLAWKPVTLGSSTLTRTEVTGLNEGDAVALPTERPLREGMTVRPVFP
jgi:HlyD family secretion protein